MYTVLKIASPIIVGVWPMAVLLWQHVFLVVLFKVEVKAGHGVITQLIIISLKVNWGEVEVITQLITVNWGEVEVITQLIRVNWGEVEVITQLIRVNWGEVEVITELIRVNWGERWKSENNLGEVEVKAGHG